MCSATTAEYCGVNVGIVVGTASIATLVFVDDIADISGSSEDAITAHINALEFALRKKLEFAPDKCFIMLVNGKSTDTIPDLYINGERVDDVKVLKYLGDIFNSKGNNEDLMDDRVKRGTASMVSIQGFMREICLGVHALGVYLLLYRAIFLQSILFNSQAWSNITDTDIKKLNVLQLKFLKRAIRAKQATSNSFVYLELGVLPISYEIHKRQLSFLHHIVHMEENDPAKEMWRNQQALPSYANWWTDVKQLMVTYSLNLSEENIKGMSKDTFKAKVKGAVRKKAFQDLCCDLKEKSRTKEIFYTELETQEYIKKLYPNQSRIVFQYRSKTLNIKEHADYQYKNNLCRWCGVADETVMHVVNCGSNGEKLDNIHETMLLCRDEIKVGMIADRIAEFISRVET